MTSQGWQAQRVLSAFQNSYEAIGKVNYFWGWHTEQYLGRFNIHHAKTDLVHPKANGRVEWTIRTVAATVRACAEGARLFPIMIALAVNTTMSRAMGATLFKLLNGFKAVLPDFTAVDLAWRTSPLMPPSSGIRNFPKAATPFRAWMQHRGADCAVHHDAGKTYTLCIL